MIAGAGTLKGSLRLFRYGNVSATSEAKQRLIDTLRRRAVYVLSLGGAKYVVKSVREENGRNPIQGFCRRTLEGEIPREHPADGALKNAHIRQGFPEGSKPRSCGPRDRPRGQTTGEMNAEKTAGGFIAASKGNDTLWEE